MIPVLGIPHYNRADLLARCLRSIDHPVGRLVIVDNSIAGLREDWRGLEIIRHPNAGVAGSWNEIIKLFPAPWWLLVNDDIEFAPGDLAKMAAAVAAKGEDGRSKMEDRGRDPSSILHPPSSPGVYYGNHGASWFAITDACVHQAGTFDENIFPAYLEDCDMSYRCDQLGIRRENVPDTHARHGDDRLTGSCTVNLNPELAAKNARTHERNFQYYRAKWGGGNGQEKFRNPFADPDWPVWAWRFDPRWRAGQQW